MFCDQHQKLEISEEVRIAQMIHLPGGQHLKTMEEHLEC